MSATEQEEIVDMFCEQVRLTFDSLRDLLDQQALDLLANELHHLAGQCRAIGAPRLLQYTNKCRSHAIIHSQRSLPHFFYLLSRRAFISPPTTITSHY